MHGTYSIKKKRERLFFSAEEQALKEQALTHFFTFC